MFDALRQDIRYALRTLRRAPGFTLAAVATLALGIGATAVVFSMVHAVLIRPFPYPEPDGLVIIDETDTGKGENHVGTSFPNFLSWRKAATSFAAIAAFDERNMAMRTGEDAELLSGARVSASLFPVLGVNPVAGRPFNTSEDVPGGAKVVLLSYDVWQRQFSGSSTAVGSTVYLDAEPHTIVGVMPQGFDFPSSAQAWVPLQLGDAEDRGWRYLGVIGRLRNSVPVEQARAELAGISTTLAAEYPGENGGFGANVQSLQEATTRNVRPILLILFGAVGFVLLIACANVANLMLARAAGRDREMAIRGAIGAGGARLVRQLLTESLVIALMGATAGTLLSVWWLDLLVSRLPADVPGWMSFSIDRTVLLFVTSVAVVTAVVFGLAPALQAGRTDLQASLKDGSRASEGVRRARLRSAFVVAQLAAAIVLLVGGFLMTRSFLAMRDVNPGFDQGGIVTMRLALPSARYRDQVSITEFHTRMLSELGTIPGVERAAIVSWFPISGSTQTSNFSIAGIGEIENTNAYSEAVTTEYFAAMGIPIMRGRAFDSRDRAGAAPVAIINQQMADRYFPGTDPIGKGIKFGAGDGDYSTIVGVAGNVNQRDVNQPEIGVDIYTPMAQRPALTGALVLRVGPASPAVISAVRERMRALDSDIPVFDAATVQEVLRNATWDSRLTGAMIGIFALGATLLAVIGLYGVISYGVQQRRHEISVRVALGATKDQVMGMVFRQGIRLTALGVASGLVLAFALSRVLGNVLFGVSSTDPVTFVAVPALLACVALVAMYIPARRATRVDPIAALRGD